jgi:iron complex outermembrane receptor protein
MFGIAMAPGDCWAQTAGEEVIVVTGHRTSDTTGVGMLGDRSVLETPLSITGYTAAMIQDQGARSTSEVLANDPSVRVQAAGDGVYDYFSIRGFQVSAAVFSLNGLYGVLPWNTLSPETVDQFEVIRGPATTFTGAAPFDNAGGMVNIQPKRAGDSPQTQLTTSFDLGGQVGAHADIGRRFGANDAWGVRVNAAYRDGELARDHQSEELSLFALGADYRGERLRASIDVGRQNIRFDGATYLFYIYEGTPVPDAPETDDNFFPEWSYGESTDTYIAGRVRA